MPPFARAGPKAGALGRDPPVKRRGVVTVVAEAVHTASLIVGFRLIDPSRELSGGTPAIQTRIGRLMMTEIARAILKDEEDGFVPVCYTGAVAPSCFCS